MAYIGTPPSNAFTSLLKQDFSTSATTGYTLDHAVNNANDIALFINFVRQEPTAAYSASGTTLTLTSATASSDDMYCVYLGQALQTVNPPNASVGTSQLVDDAVTKDKVSNLMYPSFQAYLSSDQTVTSGTTTKIQLNTEDFDTDNAYDNSTNYRFTPQVSGKYFVYATVRGSAGASTLDLEMTAIYKNGSTYIENQIDFRGNDASLAGITVVAIVDMNGSSDYLECYGRCLGGTTIKASPTRSSIFGAYRIGD